MILIIKFLKKHSLYQLENKEKLVFNGNQNKKVHSEVNGEDGFDSDEVWKTVLNVVVEPEDSKAIFEDLELWLALIKSVVKTSIFIIVNFLTDRFVCYFKIELLLLGKSEFI